MKPTYTGTMKGFAALALLSLAFATTSQSQVQFKLDTIEALAGDSITVPIHVTNFTNAGSLTLFIQYTTSMLTFGGARNWNAGFGLNQPLIHASGGVVAISWLNVYGATITSGDLVELRFKYINGSSGLGFTANCELTDVFGVLMPTLYQDGLVKQALSVTVTGTPSTLCSGGNAQLNAAASGGTGVYSYAWTSIPAGFSSTIANPSVSPTVTTTYTCVVDDGVKTVMGEKVIAIYTGGAPATPANLLPTNNSLDLSSPINFSWSASSGATSYDLYIWPAAQSQPGSPSFANLTQILKSVTVGSSGLLVYGQEYKWTVVAKNACYNVQGPTQTFTARALPNLHVTSLTFTQPLAGQPMTITWTVTNDGAGPTVEPVWYDRIWISGDIELRIGENDDIMLGQYPNLTYLPAGASYTQAKTVVMPSGISGPYFIWVVVDDLDALFIQWPQSGPPLPYNPPPYYDSWTHGGSMVDVVRETNDRDNYLYREAIFPAAPTADLKPLSSITPSSTFSGQTVNLSWTVINEGDINLNASNTWFDRVYFSSDTLFNPANATVLGSFSKSGPVPIDSSYTLNASVTIPNNISGRYFFYIKTDATDQIYEYLYESNNMWRSDSIIIILTPPPDLYVPIITIPDTVSNGQWAGFSWSVQNIGGSSTTTPSWKDKVFLSQNPSGSLIGAIAVGIHTQPGSIAAGSSYSVQKNIQIPPGLSGPYYVLIQTDFENSVFEFTNENNNITRSDTTLYIVTPDLFITQVMAPLIDSTGSPVLVKWVTKNVGSGKIFPDWSERLYISTNPAYNSSAIAGPAVNITTDLAVGDSLLNQASIALPANSPGPFFFHIVTDRNQTVYESDENNNVGSTTVPLQIFRPDLIVQQVMAPAMDTSGKFINIHWIGKNQGQTRILNGTWKDRIYLSRSMNFYPDSVVLLGEKTFNRSLLTGDTLMAGMTVQIPNGYSGIYYLFIQTDAANQIYEKFGESNNVSSAMPIQIILGPWPDLMIIGVSVPDTANIGYSGTIPYTIKNAGTKSITQQGWTDRLFFSTDPSWNISTATLMASVQHTMPLLTDSIYNATFVFNLPATTPSGSYWVYVYTDQANTIYEHTDEANNVIRTGPIFLKAYPPIDLVVTAMNAPNSANSGASINITWTVNNSSTAVTLPSYWHDAIYLSSDSVWSSGDVKLAEVQKQGGLQPGASYNGSKSFNLPNGASGLYYLLLVADFNDNNHDVNRANNVGKDRNGGAVALPISITLTPPPDLQVANLAAPPNGISGQSIEAIWTILNAGTNVTTPGTWVDRFYLSTDFTVDQSDAVILTRSHTGALNPGQYYTDTAELVIPVQYSGNYILLLKTDANDNVYEHSAESNNVYSSLIYLTQPPPADLVVLNVNLPDTALVGANTTIHWTIKNTGQFAANGSMKDIVYLSDDDTWDANDPIIGSVQSTISIPPLTTLQRSLTATLPGVALGSYHVIVRTDILNNIYETNDTNNIGVSADSMVVTVKRLPFNTIVVDTLHDFRELYYMVDVPDTLDGETMLTTLKGDSLFGTNELYIRYNIMASRVNYDFKHEDPFRGVQQVIVPSLTEGSYYMLFYGNSPVANYQPVELSAEILDFEILSVSGTKGGNGGQATVMLTGSKFDSLMTVKLIMGSSEITAQSLYFIDISRCVVTFDLDGSTIGDYDVVAVNTPGDTAVLTSGYEVVNATAPLLSITTLAPANTRIQRVSGFTVEFENSGTVDIVLPVLEIKSFSAAPIALEVAQLANGASLLQIPLNMEQGPPGIIPPGYRGQIVVYTFANSGLGFMVSVPGYY